MELPNLFSRVAGFLFLGADHASKVRYRMLRRNIAVLMLLLTVIPLTLMALIDYRHTRHEQVVNSRQLLTVRTEAAVQQFSRFYDHRRTLLQMAAQTLPVNDGKQDANLDQLLERLQHLLPDLQSLSITFSDGRSVISSGSVPILDPDFIDFDIAVMEGDGTFISGMLHTAKNQVGFAINVPTSRGSPDAGKLGAFFNAEGLSQIAARKPAESGWDHFVVNRAGVLQSNSHYFGPSLQKTALPLPSSGHKIQILKKTDPQGRQLLLGSGPIPDTTMIAVVAAPYASPDPNWFNHKRNLFLIISVFVVGFLIFVLSDILARSIRDADQRREFAFRELAHSQKLSSIGRLAAGVAHEINNPLAIINEKAGLIQDIVELQVEIDKDPRYLELAQSILQSVERCRAITHRLLGFARRLDGLVEKLDLNELLVEVIGFLEKEALHRQVTFRLEPSPALPHIYSDRGQLQQVFLNILTNALESVESGGYTAIFSRLKDPQTVEITIEDNGKGMSDETLRHIFEPFFTTKKDFGTGLGLPITYGIVTKLGGKISVNSTPGQGTRFIILLPLTCPLQTEPEQSGVELPADQGGGPDKKVHEEKVPAPSATEGTLR